MNNTKTPVMVLQELAVAKEWILPEYTIVHAVEGTHDNIFHYQVAVHGEAAIGVGRSKKEAKHKAASLLLEKLSDVVDCNLRTQPSVPEKKLKLVNAVGILCDICGENKIPMPIFTQISDVGPPHCREFTYECQVATLVTRATASTKKQAKHWAAKEMTDRIMTALPDLITEYEDQKSSALAIDDRIKDEYAHAKLLKPKPNLSLQIEDRHMHLKNIATEKGLDSDCVQMCTSQPSEENLKILLEKLELKYFIQTLQETVEGNCVVTLSLDTDVPFTVMGMGCNNDAAVEDVVKKACKYLKIMLT